MEATWPTSPSELTSSGSGAVDAPWDAQRDVDTSYALEEWDDLDRELTYHSSEQHHAFVSGGLLPGEHFNAKVAPAFDGRGQWFVFEEMVQDWQDITTIDESKRGAHLKNRLSGEAVVYRSTLDREKLADKDNGVQYFMDTIRPHFLKGVQNVFLYRLFQFMKLRRGKLEINRWLAKYSLMRKRLMDAWNDLHTPMDPSRPVLERNEEVRELCRKKGLTMGDLSDQQRRDLLNEADKEDHLEQFPFKDNLYTLIFLIQSDLSEQQRLLFMSQMSIRKLKMQDWTWEIVRDLFLELLAAPKSNFDDPNVRPRNDYRERSFFLLEEESGYLDGHSGYWVEEEETGLVGFLDEFDDEFWVMNDDSSWQVRRFKGRRMRKGKGRGGKGRGSKGRPRFRRRGKGKGYSADAESWPQEEAYKGGKKGKSKGFGKKGKKSSPFEKGKKSKGKGKSHEAEATSTPQAYSPPAKESQEDTSSAQQADNSASWQEEWPETEWHWNEESWQVGDWNDQSWTGWSTGSSFLENVVSSDRPACCFDVLDMHHEDIFKMDPVTAWHTAKPVNIKMQPTYVIMDLGCTRSMGSLMAVEAFEWAAYEYGIHCTWERCNTVMSFADSRTEVLNWCVVVHFPTTPPVTTTIDVHESGNIPILLSFPQMIRLGFDFKLRPWACKVSSEALGFKDEPLEFSNSRHAVLDLARITGHFKKMGDSSQTSIRPTTPLSFTTQDESSVLCCEPKGHKSLVPDTGPSGPVSVKDQSNIVVTTETDSENCNAFSAQIKSPNSVDTEKGARWCDAENDDEYSDVDPDMLPLTDTEDECFGSRLWRKTTPQELEERTRLHKAVGPRPGQGVIPKWRVERTGAPLPKWNAAGPPPPKKAGPKVKPGGPPPKVGAKAKPKRQRGNLDDIVPGAKPTGGRSDDRIPVGKPGIVRLPKLGPGVGVSEPRVNSEPVSGDEAIAPVTPKAGIPDGSAPEDQPNEHEQLKKSLAKIHGRLSDKAELLKLHLKHYHMSLENFKKRTSQLQLPPKVYEDYAEIVRACESCTPHAPAPERSRVTGMRATTPGDLVFVDHVDISIDNMLYCILICIDAASNLIWAGAQSNKEHSETRAAMQRCFDEWHLKPRAICGDSYFMESDFKEWYAFHGIKPIELGPHTPWPNRAEAAVKLFKHYAQILIDSIRSYAEIEPAISRVTVRQILSRAVWARNLSLTYGGKCPLEIFSGQRPPDVIDPENSLPEQLTATLPTDARIDLVLKDLAQKAHTEARQSLDIRRDLAVRLRHSEGPFKDGQSVWYWQRDMSKLRDGKWIRSRVVGDHKPPMVGIDLNGTIVRVNESKLKLNPDPWHDVVIPGLDNRDTVVTVPGVPPSPKSAASTPPAERPAPGTPEPHLRVGLPPSSSSGLLSVGSPELWLPKEDGRSYFMQVCCHSDKLSAWADAYVGAPEPIVLSGPGFTKSDRTGLTRGLQRIATCQPAVLWVSLCTNESMPQDSIAPEFCFKAIEQQYSRFGKFVFAYPWDGALWANTAWCKLIQWPGVRTLQCNMSSWHSVVTSNPGNMCLVIGGPSDWCDQLSHGPYPVHKAQPATEQDWHVLMSDSYPDKFCEQTLMTLVSGIQSDKSWPVSEPGHISFMTDLLDDLTKEEVECLKTVFTGEAYLGIANRSVSVAAATTVQPCLVTNAEVKWFMNWLNSRRNGYTGSKSDLSTRQFEAVRKLRQIYFPECIFDYVLLIRGNNATQLQDIQAGENQAVVIMWKKSNTAKYVYASVLDAIDFSASANFSLNKWSIVILYNKGGGSVRHHNKIGGGDKAPVDLRSLTDGSDPGGGQGPSGGSSPPRPPSPPGPPSYQPPVYSDPDMVIPPWPGTTYTPSERTVPMNVDQEGSQEVPRFSSPTRDVDNVPGPSSPSTPSRSSVRRTVDKHRRRAAPKVVRRSESGVRVGGETDDNTGIPASSSSQIPVPVNRGRSQRRTPSPPQKAPPPRRPERSRSHDSYRDMPGLEDEYSSGFEDNRGGYRERSRSRDGSPDRDRYFRERSRSRDDPPQSYSEDEEYGTPTYRTPEEFLTPTRSEPSSSSRHRMHTRSPSVDRGSEAPRGEPARRTAVKSLPKHRCPPNRDPVEHFQNTDSQLDHPSDADSENEYYCGACAVLSMRGEDRCYDCLLLQDSKNIPDLCWWNMQQCSHGESWVTSCDWQSADYMDDLVVLEDPAFWTSLPDSHKLAAVAGSFDYVYDMYDDVVDISDEYSTPQVSTALYLDDSWHKRASFEEFMLDIEERPSNERHSLMNAHKNKQHTLRAVKSAEQRAVAPKRKAKARAEASAQDKREYAKQFSEAKQNECKSWLKENDVLDLVDMNKEPVQNFITGRWVLTIKRDKDGHFLKCKARWVLRGFQDRQVWDLQTDSPTSTRPGFRLQCQAAANNGWDLTHIDLKTAFLQGDIFGKDRDIVCQLPPEAGYPPHIGARLKRAAYGLNDAPRLWWNKLDKALRSYGLVPARADRCCYVLYSNKSSLRSSTHVTDSEATKRVTFDDDDWQSCDSATEKEANLAGSKGLEATFGAASVATLEAQEIDAAMKAVETKDTRHNEKLGKSATTPFDLDGALELLLDPVTGSPAHGRQVEGVVTIHVDDALMAGTPKFRKLVVDSLRRDFQVGSEDLNDILFVGQRIRWIDKGKKGERIQVDQERKIEELSQIALDSSLREGTLCTPDLHKQYRSVLGQINWLQSRTQFQSCYQFSRCASASAKPTIADCKVLNKLVRTIREQVCCLNFWPLKGTCRLIGYPDAAFRNNEDKTSQRGQTIFLAEPRKKGSDAGRGSLVDYESQKIKRTVLSTTVAELYAFMKCFGTCQFLRGLWMDISGSAAEVHMRTDANNLVTTASTTHLPEQKETIHMINQLRTEASSGAIDDLAHVVTGDMLADCLTKHSVKPANLIRTIQTGILPNVDKHPPFRELMKHRHKAYNIAEWCVYNLAAAGEICTFLLAPVQEEVHHILSAVDWYDQ